MSGGWTFPTRPLYGVQLRPDTDSAHPIHQFRRYLEAKDPPAKRDAALLILANAPTTTELGSVEFPVARERDPLRLEALGQLFDEVDRAVLPTGAANGHRDIAAVIARQGVEPAL